MTITLFNVEKGFENASYIGNIFQLLNFLYKMGSCVFYVIQGVWEYSEKSILNTSIYVQLQEIWLERIQT